LLEGAIRNLQGAKVIDGDTVFKLYDTFGFPVDLTADVARERGLEIDQAGFEAGWRSKRRRSQEASSSVWIWAAAPRSMRARCRRLREAERLRPCGRAAEAGRAGRHARRG